MRPREAGLRCSCSFRLPRSISAELLLDRPWSICYTHPVPSWQIRHDIGGECCEPRIQDLARRIAVCPAPRRGCDVHRPRVPEAVPIRHRRLCRVPPESRLPHTRNLRLDRLHRGILWRHGDDSRASRTLRGSFDDHRDGGDQHEGEDGPRHRLCRRAGRGMGAGFPAPGHCAGSAAGRRRRVLSRCGALGSSRTRFDTPESGRLKKANWDDGVGGGPLRSESARLPSVTLALAAPGPPVQLRWTTLRVQGPTLRDAALANGGNGSPPVARGPPPLPPDAPGRQLAQLLARGGKEGWSAYWFLGYPFG